MRSGETSRDRFKMRRSGQDCARAVLNDEHRAKFFVAVVSNVVVELCLGKSLPFEDLGDISVKGFNRPLRVHAVQWPGAA